MQQMIQSRYKIGTSLVHSYMPAEQRQEELDAFMKGDNELVVNVGVLAVGWDFLCQRGICVSPEVPLKVYTTNRSPNSHRR